MQAYKIYDMSDDKRLIDVIAHNAIIALDIASDHTGTSPDHLVVCDALGYPMSEEDEVILCG